MRGRVPVGELAHSVQFLFGGSEGGLEASGFAEPAVVLGFGDAGFQVVADLDQPRPLVGVRP